MQLLLRSDQPHCSLAMTLVAGLVYYPDVVELGVNSQANSGRNLPEYYPGEVLITRATKHNRHAS
jgi:hypothetical protein